MRRVRRLAGGVGRQRSVARPVPRYLEEPLSREHDTVDPQHMYQDSAFIEYLVDRGDEDFRQLWEDSVTRTQPYLGLERSVPSGTPPTNWA